MNDSKSRISISSLSIASVVIVCVVFLAFRGALKNEFVEWDDYAFIQYNSMIQSLSLRNLQEMATSGYLGNWQPLTWFSHAIDYHLFQLNPAGHHFTNIVLHCLNTVWVFVLFLKLASKNVPQSQAEPTLIAGGMVAALLFGIHPLRVESVVWVSERKDVLCGFFTLATYWAYLSYVSATDKKSRQCWYSAALFLMLFALMSKPMAVTIPAVLLLLDIYPLNRWKHFSQGLKLSVEKLPFFVLSLIIGVVTLKAQDRVGAMPSVDAFYLTARIVNASKSILFYIEKTLWPTHLVPVYPFPKNALQLNGWSFFPVGGVMSITLIVVLLGRKIGPLLSVTWFYYLVTVAPVIGIIQVGRQAAADRYTYLPTLGFYCLIGIGVVWLWRKNYRAMVLLGGVITVSGLGYLTVKQTEIWKNSEIFWSYIANSTPNRNAIADYNLGRAYKQKGLLKEAEAQYIIALKNDPNLMEAHLDLGLLYDEKGAYEVAEREYKLGLKISPNYANLHNNLGLLYIKTERSDMAKTELLEVLRLSPNDAETHSNLGILFQSEGLLDDAEREYKVALMVKPDHIMTHLNLGVLYKEKGLLNQAMHELKLMTYPQKYRVEVHKLLAEIYLNLGLKTEAEAELKEVQELCQSKKRVGTDAKCVNQQ